MDKLGHILDEHKHADLKIESVPIDTYEEISIRKPDENEISRIKSELYAIKNKIDRLIEYLDSGTTNSGKPLIINQIKEITNEPNIIEGIFNGEKMVGSDEKEYAVPPNYASKSKLVEGDGMKLTIRNDGTFLYKQIGPIARRRIMGRLEQDTSTQKWTVNVEGTQYKILTASVTFYKGMPGSEAIILVPEIGLCTWGAVENIISV